MKITADDVGAAMVILSLIFGAAAIIRRHSPPLRNLFIPTAIIGGFLMLALGPEGLGRITGGNGLFPDESILVWTALPGLLVNVMCAAMLLGEPLPAPRKIWETSAPHAIYAFLSSFGQFAVGALLVLAVLGPLFDVNRLAGALLEVAFGGGHGTIAGLGGLFVEKGTPEMIDLGFGLATIGMVSAVVMGTLLVNWAVRHPNISIARDRPTQASEDFDIDHHLPGPEDAPIDTNKGMSQVTAAAVFLGISIGIGWLILEALRRLANAAGSGIFDFFPLFPFTIIGGVVVQLAAVRFDFTWAVKRRAVEGLGGIATDGLVICSIGTLSLGVLGSNVSVLIVLTVASVVWSAGMLYFLGRRFFPENWFEHAITEFGEHQGNVATGYMMLDMTDPARKTNVVYGYNYRQLITRPIVGGGFISAVSVPLIARIGLTPFMLLSAAIAVALAVWGLRRTGAAKTVAR